MGLDQYLSARKYVSKWDYSKDYKDKSVKQEYEDLLPMDAPDITKYGQFAGISVVYPAGYWRKANAIHSFFVREVGEGVDECQEMMVERFVLAELRYRCARVLKADNMEAEAKEVGLETASGFFFGETEYSDWYKDDLLLTIEICDHALSLPEEYTLTYQASW
jgi:hypothetical protein